MIPARNGGEVSQIIWHIDLVLSITDTLLHTDKYFHHFGFTLQTYPLTHYKSFFIARFPVLSVFFNTDVILMMLVSESRANARFTRQN